MLCCLALVDQAAVLDDVYFDLLTFCQGCRAAPKVDVSGCQIAEAFVISAMVVMLDEGVDGRGPVAVRCRFFDSIMCSKGDELWAQEERMNFAGMRCELR